MVTVALLIQIASTAPTDVSALKSAISALESKIAALESASVPWEHRLPWFTGVVALGVAMELWVLWHDRREDMHLWRRGTVCWPPEKPWLTKYIVELVSILLITGGIVAELWAGARITEINGSLRSIGAELRSKSDQLLALVTQEAGDAQTSAKGAADAASLAQGRADRAIADAGEAERTTEKLRAQADAINKDLADARKFTNQVARLTSPRHLDGQKLVSFLKDRPKARVELLYNPNDCEAYSFAMDIFHWLGAGMGDRKGAGWEVSAPRPIPPSLGTPPTDSVDAPPCMRFGGVYSTFGFTILQKRYIPIPSGVTSAMSAAECEASPGSDDCFVWAREALTGAIATSVIGFRGGSLEGESDESIPHGTIVLVVGPKPPWWSLEIPRQ
jgi:hypothetical protein